MTQSGRQKNRRTLMQSRTYMDTKSLRENAELVGLLALIVSVILLAYEVRQTRIAIVGESYVSRAILSSDTSIAYADSDYFAEIDVIYRDQGLDGLSAVQLVRARNLAYAAKTRLDAYHFQYELGLVGDDWYKYRFVQAATDWKPLWEHFDLLSPKTTRPSFLEAVESIPDSQE